MKNKLWLLLLALLVFAVPSFAQKGHTEIRESVPEKHLYMDVPAPDPQQIIGLSRWNVNDFQCVPNPGNPSTGLIRLYCDSSTGNLTCLTSTGASCSSSGGGITQVTVLPATCTPGGTNAIVLLTVAPFGIYTCIATNTFSLNPSTANTIAVSAYGVTAAGSEDCTATFTNGSGTVTLGATAVTVTTSMIGWFMQGSIGCIDGTSPANVLTRCQITAVNSGARTLTCGSGTANANAAGTPTQHAVFGPIEDTQLALAEAQLALNTGPCPNVNIPSGFIYLTTGHFNSMTCDTQYTGSQSNGMQVQGTGRVASRFMMSNDFNLATGCPSFNSVNTCFFGKNGVTKQNMGIVGGNAAPTGGNPAAVTCIITDGTDDFTFNFILAGFAGGSSNVHGFCLRSVGANDWMIIEDGMGGVGGDIAPSGNGAGGSISQSFFGNNNSGFVQNSGNVDYFSTGWGQYGTGQASGMLCTGSAFCNVYGGVFLWQNTAINGFQCDTGSRCSYDGIRYFGVPNTASNAIYAHGGTVIVKNSTLNPGTASDAVFIDSSAKVTDGCNNNFISGVAAYNAFGANGTVYPCTQGTTIFSVAPATNTERCASSASPAVCGGFTTGSFVIAAGATTVTVNTTAVGTRNSIIPIEDDTLGTELGVTCNTATSVPEPNVSARVAGTSFTVTVTVAPVTNPKCYTYTISR